MSSRVGVCGLCGYFSRSVAVSWVGTELCVEALCAVGSSLHSKGVQEPQSGRNVLVLVLLVLGPLDENVWQVEHESEECSVSTLRLDAQCISTATYYGYISEDGVVSSPSSSCGPSRSICSMSPVKGFSITPVPSTYFPTSCPTIVSSS